MRTVASILSDSDSRLCSVDRRASVCDAVTRMSDLQVDCLLVVDEMLSPVGIFTEHDVLVAVLASDLDPRGVAVCEIMTCELVIVSTGASVEEAMKMMTELCRERLLVTDGESLCGVISIADVTQSLVRERDATISDLTHYITHG